MNTYEVYTGHRPFGNKEPEKPFLIRAEKWEVIEKVLTDYVDHSYAFYVGDEVTAMFPSVNAIIKVE